MASTGQHEMGLVKKHSTHPKSLRFYQGWKWKTFRFLILNPAGRIAWEQGSKVLYLTFDNARKHLYARMTNALSNQMLKKVAIFFTQLEYNHLRLRVSYHTSHLKSMAYQNLNGLISIRSGIRCQRLTFQRSGDLSPESCKRNNGSNDCNRQNKLGL